MPIGIRALCPPSTGEVNWYEFSTSETLLAQVTSNTLTDDPDFFLLSNLNTTPDGALNLADGALGATFLDGALGATESLYIITAGTYFLSIDSYGVGRARALTSISNLQLLLLLRWRRLILASWVMTPLRSRLIL
jgi:hypothetical protein